MDFWHELTEMRANYAQDPLSQISLPRPSWLTDRDRLSTVYFEKERLVTQGQICYAQVVQANEYLFRLFPQGNYAAKLVYSADELICRSPGLLRGLAHQLYSYKHLTREKIPEEWRAVAGAITDEYDRRVFDFITRDKAGQAFHTYMISNMIYRKHLPRRRLRGSLLPVLALPGKCESVLVLPKQYWTKAFRTAWLNGEV